MTKMTVLPRRLDFVLHEFVRMSWVSDQARDVWSSRLRRIARAWPKVELASVALGVRKCALLQLSPEGYIGAARVAASHRLSTIPLGSSGVLKSMKSTPADPLSKFNVLVGTERSLMKFIAAWNSQATADIGHFLGYPACCVKMFTDLCGLDGWIDGTWPITALTRPSDSPGSIIEFDDKTLINVFWRYLGIRNVPHLPCRLDCESTKDLGENFIDIGSRAGFSEEMAWLETVLGWPIEWSALHGIAEVRTPILKILTRTDATAAKVTVRLHSATYPAEGGRGVRFPYTTATPGLVTLSKSFQRGLEHAKTLQPDG